MTREETIAFLEKAQQMPYATPDDFKRQPKSITTEEFAEYLKDYAKPTGNCWVCEDRLVVDWGLVHGHAHCVECHTDVKMYHYFGEGKAEKEERWEYGLQNHPKHFSVPDEEDED